MHIPQSESWTTRIWLNYTTTDSHTCSSIMYVHVHAHSKLDACQYKIIRVYLLLCDYIFHQLAFPHLQEHNEIHETTRWITSEYWDGYNDSLKVSSFSLHSWTALEWHFIMLLETSRSRSCWRCNSAMWCCHKRSESSNSHRPQIFMPLSQQVLIL